MFIVTDLVSLTDGSSQNKNKTTLFQEEGIDLKKNIKCAD